MLNTKSKTMTILGIVILVLVLWGWFAIGSEDLYKAPTTSNIFIHIFVWFLAGSLTGSVDDRKINNFWVEILAFVVGGIFFLAAWLLPSRFPSLTLNEYGFTLDLKNSPLVFLISVAFLLGYYRQVVLNIFVVFWEQLKKLGIKEDKDQKGFAKYRLDTFLRGLGQVLGFDYPKNDQ